MDDSREQSDPTSYGLLGRTMRLRYLPKQCVPLCSPYIFVDHYLSPNNLMWAAWSDYETPLPPTTMCSPVVDHYLSPNILMWAAWSDYETPLPPTTVPLCSPYILFHLHKFILLPNNLIWAAWSDYDPLPHNNVVDHYLSPNNLMWAAWSDYETPLPPTTMCSPVFTTHLVLPTQIHTAVMKCYHYLSPNNLIWAAWSDYETPLPPTTMFPTTSYGLLGRTMRLRYLPQQCVPLSPTTSCGLHDRTMRLRYLPQQCVPLCSPYIFVDHYLSPNNLIWAGWSDYETPLPPTTMCSSVVDHYLSPNNFIWAAWSDYETPLPPTTMMFFCVHHTSCSTNTNSYNCDEVLTTT
ncbi:hypothetical protein J6590_017631 [Homalodisca vitripennis]|nr:hypothetical protein J6590_017631 [Homalodisca vitripennis]